MLREEERNRKLMERKEQQKLRVHEKTTWASRQNAATVAEMMGDPYGGEDSDEEADEELEAPKSISRAPKDKEDMSVFIAKKREMFLVQMSLNTKREEILKLEQKAQARDMALKESEEMLETDTKRFDLFIRENDDRTMRASEEAKRATKAKNETEAEIKELKHKILDVEREISGLEEKLKETTEAREFLAVCTIGKVPDYFEKERARIGGAAAEAVLQQDEKDRAQVQGELAAAVVAAVDAGGELPAPLSLKQLTGLAAERKPLPLAQLAELGVLDMAPINEAAKAAMAARFEVLVAQELQAVDEDAIPMYYSEVDQIIGYFEGMEEDNVFTMGNCQEKEEVFLEIRMRHDEKESSLTTDLDALRSQIDELKEQIDIEQRQCNALEARIQQADEEAAHDDSEKRLNDQREAIKKMFELCYPPDNDLDAIEMLTRIEKKLEKTFASMDIIFPRNQEEGQAGRDALLATEKAKQKARRTVQRGIQMKQQKEENERKIKSSLERAMEPVKKKTVRCLSRAACSMRVAVTYQAAFSQGKPIMFRSAPPQRKEKVEEDDQEAIQEEADLTYFGVSLLKT